MKNILTYGFQWGQTIAIPIYTVLLYCVMMRRWAHIYITIKYVVVLTSVCGQLHHYSKCMTLLMFKGSMKSPRDIKSIMEGYYGGVWCIYKGILLHDVLIEHLQYSRLCM